MAPEDCDIMDSDTLIVLGAMTRVFGRYCVYQSGTGPKINVILDAEKQVQL